MSTIPQLKWSYLTPAINEMSSPNQFLKRLLWGNSVTLPVEDIELSQFDKARETAPFVRKNGEAVMVAGHSEKFQTVSGPNIRIKRPFTPSELLYNRRPGTTIFVNGGGQSQRAAIRQHINRDLQVMADLITNSEEWLCAQALTGSISYEVADAEVITITFPRSSNCVLSLTSGKAWDAADPTAPRPLADVHVIKRVFSDEVGLQPTDAICGINAAQALLELAESGNLPAFKTDSGVASGTITFVSQFNDDGAIFLGTMGGVRFWEYSRTVYHLGVSTPLIRDDYVEFVSRSAASQRVMYYAAIPDMRAINGNLAQTERFAKSWEVEDPSAMMALAASRPLPVPRRPNAMVSLKVTNISG